MNDSVNDFLHFKSVRHVRDERTSKRRLKWHRRTRAFNRDNFLSAIYYYHEHVYCFAGFSLSFSTAFLFGFIVLWNGEQFIPLHSKWQPRRTDICVRQRQRNAHTHTPLQSNRQERAWHVFTSFGTKRNLFMSETVLSLLQFLPVHSLTHISVFFLFWFRCFSTSDDDGNCNLLLFACLLRILARSLSSLHLIPSTFTQRHSNSISCWNIVVFSDRCNLVISFGRRMESDGRRRTNKWQTAALH